MSLPNKLTLLRIALIPFLIFALVADVWLGLPDEALAKPLFRLVALFLVIVATLTDWYDGKLARETGQVTTLGKFLDPLADKMLVAAAFVAFVELQIFPSWVVILILFREFLISGLRMIASSEGRVISADRWGKHKTGWQLGCIITTISFLWFRDIFQYYGVWYDPLVSDFHAQAIFDGILYVLVTIVLFLTIVSGGLYLYRNIDMIKE